MTIAPQKLCQIEIPVSDLERAGAFYSQAFGWHPVPAEMHQYVILEVPDDCPFGISLVPRRGERSGDSLVMYFSVDVPEDVLARVAALGGKVRFGPKKLGPYGEIWQIEDPDGNRFGLHRQLKP